MSNNPRRTRVKKKPVQILIQRIFWLQLILVVLSSVLIVVAQDFELGFFWFSFIAGIGGASVSVFHRVGKYPPNVAKDFVASWPTTLSPFLYGGIMAVVAYFLFLSHILSGDNGGGLISTNLFPNFGELNLAPEEPIKIEHFLILRPQTIPDVGKLLIWCFLAGYSESFITGILRRLESHSDYSPAADEVETDIEVDVEMNSRETHEDA